MACWHDVAVPTTRRTPDDPHAGLWWYALWVEVDGQDLWGIADQRTHRVVADESILPSIGSAVSADGLGGPAAASSISRSSIAGLPRRRQRPLIRPSYSGGLRGRPASAARTGLRTASERLAGPQDSPQRSRQAFRRSVFADPSACKAVADRSEGRKGPPSGAPHTHHGSIVSPARPTVPTTVMGQATRALSNGSRIRSDR